MVVLGLVMFGGAAMLAARPYRALQWPRSTARVLRAELVRKTGSRGDLSFRLRVRIEHEVDGRRYTAATETPSTSSYAWLRQKADALAAGSHIALRFNPADPGDVFLEQDWSIQMLLLPVALASLALFFAPIGGWLVWRTLRFREIRCPACRLPAADSHRWCARCAAPVSSE
jgi:hypothetical protein